MFVFLQTVPRGKTLLLQAKVKTKTLSNLSFWDVGIWEVVYLGQGEWMVSVGVPHLQSTALSCRCTFMCLIHIYVCYVVSYGTEPTLVTSPGVLEPCKVFQLRFGYRKFWKWQLSTPCLFQLVPTLDMLEFSRAFGLAELSRCCSTMWDPNSMLEIEALSSLHQLGISVFLLLWVMWGYCNMQSPVHLFSVVCFVTWLLKR